MTLADIFRAADEQLYHLYPPEEIKAVVRILLQHHTGLTIAQIYADPSLVTPYSSPVTRHLHALASGRPLQYILGETEFCGHVFEVNENVLIPRPETEELVQHALAGLRPYDRPRVLDLCTGSGCIAVSVAAALPEAQVSACDISKEALEVARRNALRNNTSVNFFECDITHHSSLITHHSSPVTCILSNPPYIRNAEKALMRPNVLDHEPHLALFVEDHDPLVFYRAIAAIARMTLAPNGFVMVEINEALAEETAQVFRNEGFSSIQIYKDVFDKDRMLKINSLSPNY